LSFEVPNVPARERFNLWAVPVRIDPSELHASEPAIFLNTAFDERSPMFSANGRWVAYASDESGRREIYVRAFPDDGRKWQVSSDGGSYPEWSRHRPELFFQSLDGLIMAAPYSEDAARFTAGKPRLWSIESIDNRNDYKNYTVASDGRHVAAVVRHVPEAQRTDRSVMLLINALDEFGRRMPAGR
jgi:serine/threonine-protein kinase